MSLLKLNNWMAKEMSLWKLNNWMAKDTSLLEFNDWMAKEMSLLKFNNWMAKEMSLLKVNNWMAKEMSLLKFVYYKKLSIPNYIALRPTQGSAFDISHNPPKPSHPSSPILHYSCGGLRKGIHNEKVVIRYFVCVQIEKLRAQKICTLSPGPFRDFLWK